MASLHGLNSADGSDITDHWQVLDESGVYA